MPVNENESREKIKELLHKCNKALFFHSGSGAQQTKALMMLLDGPMSQKDLQEKLGIQPASISELISKLESKRFLVRERSETDRRMVMVKITEDGIRSAKKRSEDNIRDDIEICLDPVEQEQLIVLLDKLYQGFTEERNEKE